MQQIVSSQIPRSTRGARSILAAAMVGLVLPAAVLAGAPTLANLNVTVTSPSSVSASTDVTSNGGSPPIGDRGFLYSVAADYPTPDLSGNVLVTRIPVPGTLGTMTRSLNGLIPATTYAIRAYAVNNDVVDPGGLTPVQNFTTPCPVMTLPGLANGVLDIYYLSDVTAMGSFGLNDYAVTAGSLPPGITLNAYGSYAYLDGYPTSAGTFNFTITTADAYYGTGCMVSRSYSIKIATLDVSLQKLDFASELVGDTSNPPRTVTITNNRSVGVALALPFVFTGPFNQSGISTCTDPLPASTSCTVDVVFAPASAGFFAGSLDLGPLVVSLRGVGTSSATPQVYVSNFSNLTVSVIDPVTNLVRTVVPVGSFPGALTVLPGGGKVYVPNQGSDTVSVISTASNAVVATIPVSSGPAVAASTPTGDEVWVGNIYWPYNISVIDTATDTVTLSIPYWDTSYCVYGAKGIVANPTNHEMYVISEYSGKVCVFDRLAKSFLREIYLGGSPTDGVILPDGSALYVNTSSSGLVTRVALPSGAITYVPRAEGYKMDINADGSKIYLAETGGGFGYINTASNTYTAIPLSGAVTPYAVAVDDGAGRVYVTDRSTNAVHVVALSTNTEITNPGLPIMDPSFVYPIAIAVAKPNVAPVGAIPTVTSPSATPAAFSASASANVTSDGGLPIFERGFAYVDTLSGIDPLPGTPGVFTTVVSGTTGPMSATLAFLNSGTDYTYRAYAKNFAGTGVTAAGTFTTLTVVCTGVTINTTSIPNGLVGVPYPATTLTATGDGSPPYAYSISSGALPPGLALTGDTISGTPTAIGTFSVVITATDNSTGCFGEISYDVTVGTPVAPGDVVISEFRTRGVNGPGDDYVEIANRTSADIVVASLDGSPGWSIGCPGQVHALIPNGTVLSKGGHWLATGYNFSLYSYGYPDWVYSGDQGLVDIPDDLGFGLFTTAEPANYEMTTRLDAVGSVLETDPLYYEGTPLVDVVQAGPTSPAHQTAWVRRTTNAGALSDVNDNSRDFVFVATDAGTNYGPAGDVPAVLGAPSPEDSYAVHDVLQSELPASLLDPSKGQDRWPNREVLPYYSVEYRRRFTNNTGKDITTLAFKVIDLTTLNSRKTVGAAYQATLLATDAPPLTVEVPLGSNNFVDLLGSQVDYAGMYPLTECCTTALGGVNSRLIVPLPARKVAGFGPLGFGPPYPVIAPNETVAVNIRARVWGTGYYFFVIMPQISFDPPPPPCGGECAARGAARSPRTERTGPRPAVRR